MMMLFEKQNQSEIEMLSPYAGTPMQMRKALVTREMFIVLDARKKKAPVSP